MKKRTIMRWSFAAAAAVSLAFGTAQAVAAPGPQKAGGWCEPDCETTYCGPDCGPGWCGPGGCYCYC
ncbi:MAG TPA: hypothetical protein VF006_31070 [Longimicrobium sp.]